MKMAIENGFNYVTFDFTGSGMSDGKFVSLGIIFFIQLLGYY